jgi:hypothetical protein
MSISETQYVLKILLVKAEKSIEKALIEGINLPTRRNERALRTIRNLRFRQKHYTKKIDILCRDIVGAHSEFIEKLSILTFSLQFHESLLGLADVCGILDAAGQFLRHQLQGTAIAVFMIEPKGSFNIHFGGSWQEFEIVKSRFESWFTPRLVHEISHSRQICTLEQMLAMGLQASPTALKHISIAAVPLGQIGKTMGFVLFYRPADLAYTPQELARVAAVMPALRIAIDRIAVTTENPAQEPTVSK